MKKIISFDMDLCPGTNCPKRKTCKRFTIWQNTNKPTHAWWIEPQPKDCKLYLLTKQTSK